MTQSIALIVFVGVYFLIATERVERVPAALAGAAALLATGVMHSHDAFFSLETGIDWNVIFLLFGMMIIVGIIGQTGLFEYLGGQTVRAAHGNPKRVMTLLILLTAVGSALLDNVTTILLVGPVTLAICKTIRVRPVPFLLVVVFASNIGGAATLIGDPPNIIIGSKADLSFNDFLVHVAPIAIIAVLALIVLSRWLFRGAFAVELTDEETPDEVVAYGISDRALLTKGLGVLGLVLVGFALHSVTHAEPAVVALVGAGVLVAISGIRLERCMEEVEWETLVFFMALFVVTGALVKTGVIEDLATVAADAMQGHLLAGSLGLLVVSGVLSGLVDNIPYVAVMSPLVQQVVADSHEGDPGLLWWALTLGADFGGNATIVGASANVVMLGIAKKHGHEISFWDFMKKGAVVSVMSLVLAGLYLWLRYFVLV